MKERYCVWVWLDAAGRPAFVGRGVLGRDDAHPADRLWELRQTRNTQVSLWLRTLPSPPARDGSIPDRPFTKRDVRAIYRTLRKRYAELDLPTSRRVRALETYNAGHKPRRAVVIKGMTYPSVRAAGRALKVSATTIMNHCQSPCYKDWQYADG